MPIPVVTCGADQVLPHDVASRTRALTASATEAPTGFKWTMLSIPVGSVADVGANGNFTNGVSTVQNPSFDIDGNIDGTYVLQCQATNDGSGIVGTVPANDSAPSADKQSGQTNIVVRTLDLQLYLPGDFQYNWGLVYADLTLRALEAAALAATTDINVKVTGADTTPGNLQTKINAINGLQEAVGTPAGDETLDLSPVYGTAVNTVCQGNDSRLSTPLTTKGDLYGFDTGNQRLAVGADDNMTLLVNAAAGTGLRWGLKHNLAASVAPAAGNDSTENYEPGSVWVDTTANLAYICLDASAAAAVWTEITKQGAETYTEEFVAAAGANTFTLSTSPRAQANTLSGRDIRGVYRNGIRSRYVGTPTLSMEYDQTSGTDKIDVVGQTGGEIFVVVYGV